MSMRLFVASLLTCAAVTAGEFPVGSKIEAIAVSDHGAPKSISPSAAKAIAVIFVSTQCPVSNAYNDRLSELQRDYSSRGVQFVFVNANAAEEEAEIDAHAKSHGWAFPVYKDEDNKLADRLNAQVTPEVFLFDQSGALAYHGRVDNARDLDKVKSKDARAAFDEVLAGKPVTTGEAKAFGCTIKRKKAS